MPSCSKPKWISFKEVLKDAYEPHELVLAVALGSAWACYILLNVYIHKTTIILCSLLSFFMACTLHNISTDSFYWLIIWFLTLSIIRTFIGEQFSPSDQLDWFSSLRECEGCSKNFIGMMYCSFIERNKRIMSKERYCKIDLWMQAPTMARRCWKVWLQELGWKNKTKW